MLDKGFYFGTYAPQGWASLITKSNFSQDRKILVHNRSFGVKQQLFGSVKNELDKRKINYVDLPIDKGIAGIAYKDVIIADAELAFFEKNEDFLTDEFIDPVMIENNKEKIGLLQEEKEKSSMRCQRFLTACNKIIADARRLDEKSIDVTKINIFAARLWKKYGGKMTGRVGRQTRRFCTCITSDGVELNMEPFDNCCKKIIVICDKTGACSKLIVDRIRRYALGAGYDIISCICPMNIDDGAEHLIIPELEFGLFSSAYYHRADFENSRKIFASRFHNSKNDETKQRIDFTLRAFRSLMSEAFLSIEKINRADTELDSIYFDATDTEQLNKAVLKRLFN